MFLTLFIMYLAAGMLFVSGVLLVYTAIVVPVQIFVWDYSDPCDPFPTLKLDIFIDTFFMVIVIASQFILD